jgi:hypothetical protein
MNSYRIQDEGIGKVVSILVVAILVVVIGVAVVSLKAVYPNFSPLHYPVRHFLR